MFISTRQINLIMEKEIYQHPQAELIHINHPLSLLLDLSADGNLGDFEDGGEF